MNRDQQQATLEVLRDGLGGVDFIARREVLKRLLKSGALFQLAGAGGAGVVASLLRSTPAWAQNAISDAAMSEAGPDRQFEAGRLWFGYVAEGALDILMGPDSFTCPDATCGEYVCGTDGCSDFGCGDNLCGEQSCGGFGCSDDSCVQQSCGDGHICGGNECDEEGGVDGCLGEDTCDRQQSDRMNPSDFLDQYGDTPFVRELKELFGDGLVGELDDMLKTGTSLRDRGLLGPGALRGPTGLTPTGRGPLMEGLPSPSDAGQTGEGAPKSPTGSGAAGQGPSSALDGVGGKTPSLRFGPDQLGPEGMEMRTPPPPPKTSTPTQ